MNRKQDIADKLRTHVDRLNFFIAVAKAEGLHVNFTLNITSDDDNILTVRKIFEIKVQDLKNPLL